MPSWYSLHVVFLADVATNSERHRRYFSVTERHGRGPGVPVVIALIRSPTRVR